MTYHSSNGILLKNAMDKALDDPQFNDLQDDFTKIECNKPKNRRILMRNISTKFKRETILRLLNNFGDISDDRIDIPRNQKGFNNKEGFICVFAEFETSDGAEKARRELNSPLNQGLNINVEFAYDKPSLTLEMAVAERQREEDALTAKPKKKQTQPVCHPPITVNFKVEYDDVYERVTAFERKKVVQSKEAFDQQELCKTQAQNSKGIYDVDERCVYYNQSLIGETYQCCNCLKEALYRCDKTKLFYCDLKCSTLKKEAVNSLEEYLEKNELIHAEPIKVNDKVIISSIINEKCLYVRRADIDDSRHMNIILKRSKRPQKLEMSPDIGDLVLVNWLDEIYRAKVIDISDEEPYAIFVQLIDYGNTARVFLKDLMVMGRKRLDCIVEKIILKDVKVEAINSNVIAYLNNLLSEKIELAVTSINENGVVLIDKLTMTNVNQRIVELSVVEETSYDQVGVSLKDLSSEFVSEDLLLLEPDQRVFVVNSHPFQEKSEIIYCVHESKMKDLRELYRSINVYGNNQKSAEAGIPNRDNELCLVFCNNQWHRAVVLNTEGDGKPECLLIDLWSKQKIDVTNIIPMPLAFKFPPILNEPCEHSSSFSVEENDWLKVDVGSYNEEGFLVLHLK